MNRLYNLRSLKTFVSKLQARYFHLTTTRSIEWADIDEYTNKVNVSVPLTTDVYEKDGMYNE